MAATILFPDNPKREARVQELISDINNLVFALADDANEIKCLLQKLDEEIRKLYNKIEVDIPSSATKQVHFGEWVADVIEFAAPFIAYSVVEKALEEAATCWLLREGRIGEAALARLVGLPGWLRFAKFGGGIGAFIVGDLLVSGILGAIKRDKLRDAIHSAIQPRINLKKAAIINGMLKDKLSAIVESFTLLAGVDFTKKQLNELHEKAFDDFKKEVDKVTEDTAKQGLAELDKSRDSWTNEDN